MPFLQTLDTSIQELTIVNIKGVHPALSKKSCLLIPVSARSPSALILFCLVFKFNYQWNSESKKGVSPFFKRPIIILASVSILIRGFSLVCCYCSCEVGGFPVSLSLHDPRYTKDWLVFHEIHCWLCSRDVYSEQRLKVLELLNFCVSWLIFILFSKIAMQLRLSLHRVS